MSKSRAKGVITITDGSLGIDWKIPTKNALLSEKEMKHEMLKDLTVRSVLMWICIRRLGNTISACTSRCDMRSIRTGRTKILDYDKN